MQIEYSIEPCAVGRVLTAKQNVTRDAVVWRNDSNVDVMSLSLAEIRALPDSEREMFEHYCWQTDADQWDGMTGDPDRDPVNFINHSCDPNMHFLDDDTLVARRDIPPGEQLTLDYATCDTVYAVIEHCQCDAMLCRGKITAQDAYNPSIMGKYGSHVRSFLKLNC